MVRGPHAHGIGEVGPPIGVDQVAILHFHEVGARGRLQPEIDAGALPVGHLSAQAAKALEAGNDPRQKELLREPIGHHGVRTDDPAIGLKQL